jgi:predicted transposase YdaD
MDINLDNYFEMMENPKIREYIRQQKKARNDYEHSKAVCRKEGIAEGIAIGEQRGIAIGKQRSIDIAKQRGIAIGKLESKLETAKIALSRGFSIPEISIFTGLAVEEIENLKE